MTTTRGQASQQEEQQAKLEDVGVDVQTGDKRKDHPDEPAAAEADKQPKAKATKVEDGDDAATANGDSKIGKENGKIDHTEDHEMKDESGDDETNSKAKIENSQTNGSETQKQKEEKLQEKREQKTQQGDAPSRVATDYSDESTTLEKGVIYFFFRPRVELDDPKSLQDVQRGFIVLRPLKGSTDDIPDDGPLKDAKNLRLIAIPKKSFPGKGGRNLAFVEKSKVSAEDLKSDFLKEINNETKTMGTRHTGAPVPVFEGVYSLVHNKNTTYLLYIATAPGEEAMGSVQEKFGISKQRSFVVSVRNPQFESPPYARLPESAKYPQDYLDEFQGLRWLPLHPKHLAYEYCEFLILGDKTGTDFPEDNGDGEIDGAVKELEQMEEADESRVEHLDADHPFFDDLQLSAKDYPDMLTNW